MSFRFRPVLAIATVIGLSILVALGTWQMQRRAWKLDLIAKTEARVDAAPEPFDAVLSRAVAGEDVEYTAVFLEGAYDHDREAPVFGTLDGQAGAYVFTPLDAASRDDGGKGGRGLVYVNRGFVLQALRDPAARSEGQIEGEVRVEGLFRTAEKPGGIAALLRPADQPADDLWFSRDPQRLAAHHGAETVPYYIDSFGRENPGDWPKGGTTRLDFNNRHLEYALTWYGLAAALVGVYLAFSLRRRPSAPPGPGS